MFRVRVRVGVPIWHGQMAWASLCVVGWVWVRTQPGVRHLVFWPVLERGRAQAVQRPLSMKTVRARTSAWAVPGHFFCVVATMASRPATGRWRLAGGSSCSPVGGGTNGGGMMASGPVVGARQAAGGMMGAGGMMVVGMVGQAGAGADGMVAGPWRAHGRAWRR